MKALSPIVNVLGVLLCVAPWLCLMACIALLARGARRFAMSVKRGGFCGWLTNLHGRNGLPLLRSGAVWVRARRSKRPC